jgi:hypothetical protein
MPLIKNAVRLFATGSSAQRPLLGRYKAFPKTMFRVQGGSAVKLREYQEQAKRGRYSYDLEVASDGFVNPKKGDTFEGQLPFLMRFLAIFCSSTAHNRTERNVNQTNGTDLAGGGLRVPRSQRRCFRSP